MNFLLNSVKKDGNMLTIIEYSDKSFIVSGENTKKYIEILKELGGKWNPNLRDGPAWIFSNKQREKVEEFVDRINIHSQGSDKMKQFFREITSEIVETYGINDSEKVISDFIENLWKSKYENL